MILCVWPILRLVIDIITMTTMREDAEHDRDKQHH